MTGPSVITEEVSNSKVAAVFASEAMARDQAARLRQALALGEAQVVVVTPRTATPGRKLEPESHGIFRTMMWAHARLGVIGALLGLAVFALLWFMGIPLIVNSALLAGGVLLFFGAVAGLMLGGLATLRPDHDPYLMKVMGALREGRSAVVVHAFSADQRKQAQDWLQQAGGETIATL